MDNVNRSIAMKMMTATTQKHKHQQFIFLTPLVCLRGCHYLSVSPTRPFADWTNIYSHFCAQDMSQTELRDQSNLKIFKMPDPERWSGIWILPYQRFFRFVPYCLFFTLTSSILWYTVMPCLFYLSYSEHNTVTELVWSDIDVEAKVY